MAKERLITIGASEVRCLSDSLRKAYEERDALREQLEQLKQRHTQDMACIQILAAGDEPNIISEFPAAEDVRALTKQLREAQGRLQKLHDLLDPAENFYESDDPILAAATVLVTMSREASIKGIAQLVKIHRLTKALRDAKPALLRAAEFIEGATTSGGAYDPIELQEIPATLRALAEIEGEK